MKKQLIFGLLISFVLGVNCIQAQSQSVARKWNELNLLSIENDYTRPTIQARNLHHISAAMYDAWAVYDSIARPYFLGNTVHGYVTPYDKIVNPSNISKAREEAISYAAYRLLLHRYKRAPKRDIIFPAYYQLMDELNLDTSYVSIDYASGDPRAMGNYIAHHIIQYGLQDGANEVNDYVNTFYKPLNPPLKLDTSGTSGVIDLNRWQPLQFSLFIDQGGNINPDNVPAFLSAEWGNVSPFSMKEMDRQMLTRDSLTFQVYNDTGAPPYIESQDSVGFGKYENMYKYGNLLVSQWASHLDDNNELLWDISPNSIGNVEKYPTKRSEYPEFYNIDDGGDHSPGYDVNPKTGLPYTPQYVKRADYARVLAEFWADGPSSETPPGHWYTILNYASDHPMMIKKFKGRGQVLDALEWDIKSYFALGGAVHDAGITAWSIKGLYDYVRPITAIRGMAELGQSSDPTLPRYHPNGLPLIAGHTELVTKSDPLAGFNLENLWEVKINVWRGYDYITESNDFKARVGWVLAKDFSPYQRATFVTPPFGGYISGHSTFSRAAAEVLGLFTGDEYFPGGMGEFKAEKDSFLIHENGPSSDVILQWAKYKDASDQCSLSRIWGGIHPPCDDIPGRIVGKEVGIKAFDFCVPYFYKDEDNDGYFSFEDCDDQNPSIHPGATEVCDGVDNNCNLLIDDGITSYTHYIDKDADGFGDINSKKDTCLVELSGYVSNHLDCNDNDSAIHPGATEIVNNGIDEDCDGEDLISNTTSPSDELVKIFPNPASDFLNIQNVLSTNIKITWIDLNGRTMSKSSIVQANETVNINLGDVSAGIYILKVANISKDYHLSYHKVLVVK